MKDWKPKPATPERMRDICTKHAEVMAALRNQVEQEPKDLGTACNLLEMLPQQALEVGQMVSDLTSVRNDEERQAVLELFAVSFSLNVWRTAGRYTLLGLSQSILNKLGEEVGWET